MGYDQDIKMQQRDAKKHVFEITAWFRSCAVATMKSTSSILSYRRLIQHITEYMTYQVDNYKAFQRLDKFLWAFENSYFYFFLIIQCVAHTHIKYFTLIVKDCSSFTTV